MDQAQPSQRLMTIEEYGDLSDAERTRVQLSALQTMGAKTKEELVGLMTQYVHARNLDRTPVRMATLNRRFYKAAKAFNSQVIVLALEAPFKTYGWEGGTVVMTSAFAADLEQVLHSNIIEEDLGKRVSEYDEVFARFLARAQ